MAELLNTTTTNFKVGSLVQLNSGGPPMTVLRTAAGDYHVGYILPSGQPIMFGPLDPKCLRLWEPPLATGELTHANLLAERAELRRRAEADTLGGLTPAGQMRLAELDAYAASVPSLADR